MVDRMSAVKPQNYAALLCAVNVGGTGKLTMSDLKAIQKLAALCQRIK
jgi:uncharacterized protein (DUF1697 family)